MSRFSEEAHKGNDGFASVIPCPGTSGFSAGMVSAEEHWETGAIQVHPSQRNAFQEGKKQTSDEQQVNHLLLSDY